MLRMFKLNFIDYWFSFGRYFHLFLLFCFLAWWLLIIESADLHFLSLNVIVRNFYIIWHYVSLVVENINILLFFIQFHFFSWRFTGHYVGNFMRLIDLLLWVLSYYSHRRLGFVVVFLLWTFLVLPFLLNRHAFDHFLNLFWHVFLILHSVNWCFIQVTKWSYE